MATRAEIGKYTHRRLQADLQMRRKSFLQRPSSMGRTQVREVSGARRVLFLNTALATLMANTLNYLQNRVSLFAYGVDADRRNYHRLFRL
jgi:hypothetical protein